MSSRNRGSRGMIFSLLLLIMGIVHGTKHSFITKNDARKFIGPIGIPYGFLQGGVYNLTVFDFSLQIRGTKKAAKSAAKAAKQNENNEPLDPESHPTAYYDVGFLLKRFDRESSFARYAELVAEDFTVCSYEEFRSAMEAAAGNDDDGVLSKHDDDQFAPSISNNKIVFVDDDVVNQGIFLSMDNVQLEWGSSHTPTAQHVFTLEEEGLYFLMFQICPILRHQNQSTHADHHRHILTSNTHKHLEVRSSFELDLAYHNYDSLGHIAYLTAGDMPLPILFFYFSVSYALCLFVWVSNIRSINSGQNTPGFGNPKTSNARPLVLPIHHVMSVLLLFKTLSVFFESVRYHYINTFGHAELWSVVYYALAFIKGMLLFTVILLIGSGWSFLKPFLNDREKKVVFFILILQVIDNIAIVAMNSETKGERLYEDWKAVMHILDILCCCAVLVPIVWQVNALEQTVGTDHDDHTPSLLLSSLSSSKGRRRIGEGRSDGVEDAEEEENDDDGGVNDNHNEEEAQDTYNSNNTMEHHEDARHSMTSSSSMMNDRKTLSKLRLFRSFYILVICYIYFTRIIVYLIATMLGYRRTWIQYCVSELGTLAFYVISGQLFRPMVDNPYFAVKNEDDDDNNEEEVVLTTMRGNKSSSTMEMIEKKVKD